MSINFTDRLIGESRSWNDLWRQLCSGSQDNSAKGIVFERLTQLYLETKPEYQTKLSHVWRVRDEVSPSLDFMLMG
jgi:predicted helicase